MTFGKHDGLLADKFAKTESVKKEVLPRTLTLKKAYRNTKKGIEVGMMVAGAKGTVPKIPRMARAISSGTRQAVQTATNVARQAPRVIKEAARNPGGTARSVATGVNGSVSRTVTAARSLGAKARDRVVQRAAEAKRTTQVTTRRVRESGRRATQSVVEQGRAMSQRVMRRGRENTARRPADDGAQTSRSSRTEPQRRASDTPCPCFAAGTTVLTQNGSVAIEDLNLGDRVLANDRGEEADDTAVDETWVAITLDVPEYDDGFRAVIKALRPAEWLADRLGMQLLQRDLALGRWIFLDIAEKGAFYGEIITIEDAPTIEPGLGRVVTATLSVTREILEIHLEDQPQPIRATDEHRIWSASRERWVEAGALVPGELLATRDGGTAEIAAITKTPETSPAHDI